MNSSDWINNNNSIKSILTQVITYRLSWNEFKWLSSD